MTKPLSQMTVDEKNIAVAETLGLYIQADFADGLLVRNPLNDSVNPLPNYCIPSAESQALQFDNRINMDFPNDDNGIATTYSFKSVDDDFMELVTAENDNPCIAIVDCFLLMNGWVL